MGRVLVALLIGLSAVACGRDGDGERPSPASLPTPTSTPQIEDIGAGRVRVWPSSGPAEMEVLYRYKLYTECAVGNAIVDFDGSLWFIPPPGLDTAMVLGLDRPEASGTITLLSQSYARFASNESEIIEFARAEGSRVYPRCALDGI